jgi:hypothetical protein
VRAAPGVLDPTEALEDPRQLGRGYTRAGVAHGQLGHAVPRADHDLDLTLEGELEGVEDEGEDDFSHMSGRARPVAAEAGSRP